MKNPLIWLLVLSTGLLVSPVSAQFLQNRWHTEPFRAHPYSDSVAIPVRQGTHLSWQRALVDDQHGNWYIAWSASPNGIHGLYASKIDNNGDIVWTRTVNDGPNQQDEPVLYADSTGVTIAWVDFREGIYQNDTSYVGDAGGSVMAQKFNPDGQRIWNVTDQSDTVNAVPVCMTRGFQSNLRMITDGNYGVYIFWEDTRYNRGSDIFCNRIGLDGHRYTNWPKNGIAVAAAAGAQPSGGEYSVAQGNNNSAWAAWIDNRRNNTDIYYQQIYSIGTTRWDSLGQVFIADNCSLTKVKICPNGQGGAFFVWRNQADQTVDLYMQQINASGQKLWLPDTGVILADVPNEQTNPRIVFAGDSNAIVSWEDFRSDASGTVNADLYVQKVSGTTSIQRLWQTNGVPVCTESHQQRESRLCDDYSGGCVLVWEDERFHETPGQDIFAQHITSTGQPGWATNGQSVSSDPSSQFYAICRPSGGRFLFTWCDRRQGSNQLYRTVWSWIGTPVGSFTAGGANTVTDISGNVHYNMIEKLGSTRIMNAWVDGRRSEFGNRIFYTIHKSTPDDSNGVAIPGIAKNGNPITLDTTNTVSQDGTTSYSSPLITTTPDSGAIIVYFNTVNADQTIRAQKISYNGARVWTDYGREACSSVSSSFDFLSGSPDGYGGVYLSYTMTGEAPFYYNQVQFQHLDNTGSRLLPNTGVTISPGQLEQSYPSLVVSSGNIYLGYIEMTNLDLNIYSVHVTKLNTNGTIVWNREIAAGDSSLHHDQAQGNRNQLYLIAGDSGSVVAHWNEFNWEIAGGSGANIMAQRIDSNGNLRWGTGVRLGATEFAQIDAVGLSTGSTYWFGWRDTRINGLSSIYLQHLSANGSYLLNATGQRLADASNSQLDLDLAKDNSVGVYTFYAQWFDRSNPFPPPPTLMDEDIIGNHFLSNGTINRPDIWTPTTYSDHVAYLVKVPNSQRRPKSVPIANGAAVNWLDMRSTMKEEFVDLYMQRVRDDQSVQGVREIASAMPKQFSLQQNYPNPFNSTTVIRFTLPRTERVKVAIYDIMGREVINLLNAVKTTGTYEVRWNGKNNSGMKVSSGIYFYRMETSQGVIAKKMTLLN